METAITGPIMAALLSGLLGEVVAGKELIKSTIKTKRLLEHKNNPPWQMVQ